MKLSLKLEELFLLGLAVYLNSLLPYAWWLYLALFLTPDVGMLGYVANAKVGAFTYNLFHHKGLAIALYLVGVYWVNEPLQFVGLLLLGHSAFDRVMGYGLKYYDSFQNTHLGPIGKRT